MSAFAQFEQKVRELVDAGLSALVKRLEALEQSCADGGAVDDALAEIRERLDALEQKPPAAKPAGRRTVADKASTPKSGS